MLTRTLNAGDVVMIGEQRMRLSSINHSYKNCIITIANVEYLLVQGDAIDVQGGYMVIPEIGRHVRLNFHVDRAVRIQHVTNDVTIKFKKRRYHEPTSLANRAK